MPAPRSLPRLSGSRRPGADVVHILFIERRGLLIGRHYLVDGVDHFVGIVVRPEARRIEPILFENHHIVMGKKVPHDLGDIPFADAVQCEVPSQHNQALRPVLLLLLQPRDLCLLFRSPACVEILDFRNDVGTLEAGGMVVVIARRFMDGGRLLLLAVIVRFGFTAGAGGECFGDRLLAGAALRFHRFTAIIWSRSPSRPEYSPFCARR